MDRCAERQGKGQTKQTDGQKYRLTDAWTDEQTDRWTN